MYEILGSAMDSDGVLRGLNGWEIRGDERLNVRHGSWSKAPQGLPVAHRGEDVAEKVVEDAVVACGLAIQRFE